MAKLISKTYGNALFELAVEEKKVDVFMEEIQSIQLILNENIELTQLMNLPKIGKEEKISILETIFKGKIQEELMGFMGLIITKDRYAQIEQILLYFLDCVKELKGIGVCYVTTAFSLQDEQKKQVEKRLLETTGFNQMEMYFNTDEKIIGGMVLRIGDRVVDSSVQTKLDDLQKELLKIRLK